MANTTTRQARTPTARELTAARQANLPLNVDSSKPHPGLALDRNRAPTAAPPKPATAVAVPDPKPYAARYLDEIAPASIVGRMVKFSKEGAFVTSDDGKEIAEDSEFTALCDQTLIGWIKFDEEGGAPERVMGLLYGGDFIMPLRESLGDLDETKWPEGLDGNPSDPWGHWIYLVLQNVATLELYTFVTSSKTGRRAVGALLRHYDRMARTNPGELPVVRLSTGGFEHKDSRVGWVSVPNFIVVGRQPKDSVATPDTSTAAFIDDDLPDSMKK